MRNFIDLITKTFIAEARRGLASIGELRAKVFWNPRRPDMIQALAKSKIGDLRGSWLQTESETMWAIWPARVLGHWNFHNECAAREGIAAQTNIDFRVCRDLSILNEERYWSKATHYEGHGFYCAFFPETDISTIPELHMLFGELTPTERLAVEEADIGTRFPKASARISYDDGESEADVFVKPSVGTILKCIGNYDARALIYEDGTLVIWEQGDMYHQDVYDNPITKRPDDFLLLKLQPPGKFDAGVGSKVATKSRSPSPTKNGSACFTRTARLWQSTEMTSQSRHITGGDGGPGRHLTAHRQRELHTVPLRLDGPYDRHLTDLRGFPVKQPLSRPRASRASNLVDPMGCVTHIRDGQFHEWSRGAMSALIALSYRP